jgi:hypothetical protein
MLELKISTIIFIDARVRNIIDKLPLDQTGIFSKYFKGIISYMVKNL